MYTTGIGISLYEEPQTNTHVIPGMPFFGMTGNLSFALWDFPCAKIQSKMPRQAGHDGLFWFRPYEPYLERFSNR